ncbi:hypothetical protein [Nonlabens sp.]|uniref:hypothetical protein n=1 Tax=Nonlabens sp. TaxID=1888209 RepID=UPI003F69F05E
MSYNRAGFLDFFIASKLSRKFKVKHQKIKIPTTLNNFKIKISEFQNSNNDPFYSTFINAVKSFYKIENSFKVSLGGNGADTDWEFGEKQLKDLNKSNFNSFIKSYSELITKHSLINKDVSEKMAIKLEQYFLKKYAVFKDAPNFVQLLASAFFHLERFRGRQGYIYSQESNK